MNINLHIERLVLNDIPVSHADGPHLQATIETELARLFSVGGMNPELQTDRVLPFIGVRNIRIDDGNGSRDLGRQVAEAIYSGIGK